MAGGTLTRCATDGVFSNQMGVRLEGTGNMGILSVRNVTSQGGSGGFIDNRTSTPTLDHLILDGVTITGAVAVAGVRLGTGSGPVVTFAEVSRVAKLHASGWGALFYSGRIHLSQSRFATQVYIYNNAAVTAFKSPPASNRFEAGLDDAGSKYSETT